MRRAVAFRNGSRHASRVMLHPCPMISCKSSSWFFFQEKSISLPYCRSRLLAHNGRPIITILPTSCLIGQLSCPPWDAKLALVLVQHPGNMHPHICEDFLRRLRGQHLSHRVSQSIIFVVLWANMGPTDCHCHRLISLLLLLLLLLPVLLRTGMLMLLLVRT